MVLWWLYNGYIVLLWWLYDGFMMVISWLYDGFVMVISWLYNGFMMDIWWFCMLARWVKEANKRREMERSLLILDAQRAGLQTSVIKIIINKQVDDYCYHLHNHLHELMSLKRINHQCPPESWTTHPARTAWALAAEAVWAALRRERRRRPRSWRRSARAMNIWTGGAKLELVTIDYGQRASWS